MYTDTAGGGRLLDWNYYPLEDYLHDYSKVNRQDLLLQLGAKVQIASFLSLDMQYQYERQNNDSKDVHDMKSYYARDWINRFSQVNQNTGTVTYPVPLGEIRFIGNEQTVAHDGRAQVNLGKTWGVSGLNAIAGGEIRQTYTSGSYYNIYGYNDDVLTVANVNYATPYPNYVTGSNGTIPSGLQLVDKTNRYLSLYGNAAYTLRDRYTLSASARRDASNLFGVSTNDRWTPLWSLGGSWNISREMFFHVPGISLLRLRATYGLSGNVDQTKSAVTTIKYYSTNATYTNLPRAYINQNGNPALKWEQVRTFNVGMDFSGVDNRISGNVDWYSKKGTDLLGNAPLDYTTGIVSVSKNVAAMEGNGIDITLNTKILKGALQWDNVLLFNYYKSRVVKFNLTTDYGSAFVNGAYTITGVEGKPVYAVLSYDWAGLDKNGDPQGRLYGDLSTNYASIVGTGTAYTDLVYGGSATPTTYGSMINTLTWKGWSFAFNVGYKLGYYFRRPTISYSALFSSYAYVDNGDYARRWQHPGDESKTNVPSIVYPANGNRDNFYVNSSVLVERADHIRLQYVQLQYRFGNNTAHSGLSGMEVYGNASNLGILWRANRHQLDPEYPNTLSPPPTFSLGLRIYFNK